MNKFPAVSTLCLIALVATPFFAFAVESNDTTVETTQAVTATPVTNNRKPVIEVKNKAAELNSLRQASAAAELKVNIAQFKTTVEAKRTEAVEKFKQKRDEFTAKVAAIKDAKKKALAEKIDGKITQINTNRTEEMSKYIEKMKDLLGKIQAKSDELKSTGTDTTAVEAAIKAAQTAIDKAAAAVTAQAGKQYVAALTSETALKSNFGSVAKQLEMDLKTVRQLLIDAQKAIANAAKVLGQARGIEGSTPSATPKE